MRRLGRRGRLRKTIGSLSRRLKIKTIVGEFVLPWGLFLLFWLVLGIVMFLWMEVVPDGCKSKDDRAYDERWRW